MAKINGPINVVRMEGEINKIHKVVYIFMDIHLDTKDQTDCSDNNSIDIVKYFKNSFENLNGNKIYDFFIEVFPTYLDYGTEKRCYSKNDEELIYLEKVWKFFYENVKFEKNKISSLFKNVRLHYVDIRHALYYATLNPLNYSIYNIDNLNELTVDIVPASIYSIIKFLLYIEKNIRQKNFYKTNKKLTINNFENDIELLLNPFTKKKIIEHISYIFNKLMNSYKYENVKEFINNNLYDNFLKIIHNRIDDFYTFMREIKNLKFSDYESKDTIDKLKERLNEYNDIIISDMCIIMDLYLARRLMDKDYITNVIVYTGAAHSVSLIYILIQFGFKITHVANKKMEINKINNIISKIKNYTNEETFFDLFNLFVSPNMPQCSDLSDFPNNFE